MSNTADVTFNPTPDAGDYTEIAVSAVVKGVYDMLTAGDDVGAVDVFGEIITQDMADEMKQLRRHRAAELLRKMAEILESAE